MKTPLKTVFALYDSRYLTDEESATLYEVCDTLKEAKTEKRESFTDAVIVEETMRKVGNRQYEVVNSRVIKP